MRKKPKFQQSEYEEQKRFVKWLEAKGLMFTAVPNSTWTPSQEQKSINKASGLRAGFPDMVVVIPNKKLLCIEMKKRAGGSVSKKQREWLQILGTLPSVEPSVCNGAQEAIEFVKSHLG